MVFSGCFKLLVQRVTWDASERTNLVRRWRRMLKLQELLLVLNLPFFMLFDTVIFCFVGYLTNVALILLHAHSGSLLRGWDCSYRHMCCMRRWRWKVCVQKSFMWFWCILPPSRKKCSFRKFQTHYSSKEMTLLPLITSTNYDWKPCYLFGFLDHQWMHMHWN